MIFYLLCYLMNVGVQSLVIRFAKFNYTAFWSNGNFE